MRITPVQDIIHWADKTANLAKTENQLAKLSGTTDLVVLPEMFTTGFCTDQLDLAETNEGETMCKIKDWAQKFNFAITGSFIATENNNYYNRGFFAFPDGGIQFADKRHLFSVGGEDKYFSSGENKPIISYCGFNIRLLVCYDIRFPVWSRNVDNQYDILIYVANFPASRIKNWDILLRARAIENQAYVCGVNCTGTDGAGIHYNGHSALLDYKATALLTFPDDVNYIQTYDLQMAPLIQFRKKSAFWKDADKFEIL